MIPRKSAPMSQEEQDVINLENRRVSAESALSETASAVKVLEEKQSKITKSIADGEALIVSNQGAIDMIQERLADVSADYVKKVASLKEEYDEKVTTLAALDNEIHVSESKLKGAVFDIENQSKKFESDKESQEAALAELESKKNTLKEEIDTLGLKIDSSNEELCKAKSVLSDTEIKIENLKTEKGNLEVAVATLGGEVDSLKDKIKDCDQVILDKSGVIKGKESEIKSLDLGIAKKTEEYKSIESKAFSILQREELLNQKEAYIKSQFARAGIKYE